MGLGQVEGSWCGPAGDVVLGSKGGKLRGEEALLTAAGGSAVVDYGNGEMHLRKVVAERGEGVVG